MNKTRFDIMIFISIFVENWIKYDTIHDFIKVLIGSNPADINRL